MEDNQLKGRLEQRRSEKLAPAQSLGSRRAPREMFTRSCVPADVPTTERACARMFCSILLALDRLPLECDFIPEALAASRGSWAWSTGVLRALAVSMQQDWRDDENWLSSEDTVEAITCPVQGIRDLVRSVPKLSLLVSSEDAGSFHPGWRRILNSSASLRRQVARDTLDWLAQAPDPDDELPVLKNVGYLAQALDLPPTAAPLLRWMVLAGGSRKTRSALASIEILGHAEGCALIGRALGVPEQDILELLRADRPLRQLALAGGERERCSDLEDLLTLKVGGLEGPLRGSYGSFEEFLSAFLLPAESSRLEPSHFPHLAKVGDFAVPLLANAAASCAGGINVMLYGAPGTGKTEYAKVLARQAGLKLFEVKFRDDAGGGLTSDARLGSLLVTQHALRGRSDCAILLDEAEDVFPAAETPIAQAFFGRRNSKGATKAWTNRLLEQVGVPVIWTCNSIEQIEDAFLRRFALTVEVGEPPRTVRRRIAEQYLSDLAVPSEQLDAIAALPRLVPSHLELAARTAKLAATQSPELAGRFVQQQLNSMRRALGLPPGRVSERTVPFDPAFIHLGPGPTSSELVAALRRTPRSALCFHGVPGTGKTEMARYLADELDRELVVTLGSDLLSKWVGGTERNIARMFGSAGDRSDDVVLLLDEADSLLRDRASAQTGWEITQTNEFLAQMDAFPGIFICTTNLYDGLDPAVVRRFQLRVEFLPLSIKQRRAMFAAILGDEAPASIDSLEGLVPADFANVARQAAMLERVMTPAQLAEQLRIELTARRPRVAIQRRIGFAEA